VQKLVKNVPSVSALELPAIRQLGKGERPTVSDRGGRIDKPKAFVLDDNPETLQRVGGQLEKQGFEVTTARTLDEAKERFSGDFALVVSDLDVSERFFDLRGRFGGYLFVDWMLKQGYEGMTVLHSTTFDNPFLNTLLTPLKRNLERRGVFVQGKKTTWASMEKN
jgi:CheY-like chemotaxis protein